MRYAVGKQGKMRKILSSRPNCRWLPILKESTQISAYTLYF